MSNLRGFVRVHKVPSGLREDKPSSSGRISRHQDEILNRWRHEGHAVKLVTLTGEAIVGQLVAFDTYSLVLQMEDGQEHLFFKHGLLNVSPC